MQIQSLFFCRVKSPSIKRYMLIQNNGTKIKNRYSSTGSPRMFPTIWSCEKLHNSIRTESWSQSTAMRNKINSVIHNVFKCSFFLFRYSKMILGMITKTLRSCRYKYIKKKETSDIINNHLRKRDDLNCRSRYIS